MPPIKIKPVLAPEPVAPPPEPQPGPQPIAIEPELVAPEPEHQWEPYPDDKAELIARLRAQIEHEAGDAFEVMRGEIDRLSALVRSLGGTP